VSLRRSLAIGSVALSTAALAVFVVLMWTTTQLRSIDEGNTKNLESVRLAEEAKIDLLLLAGTNDPSTRRNIEDDLLAKLAESRDYVTTEAEAGDLSRAQHEVEAYVHGEQPTTDAAYASVDALISQNSRQTADALARGRSLERATAILGLTSGVLLVFVVGVFLWWVQRRGIWPIFAIGDAMTRFGRGEHEARAVERGPTEVRELAARFNEMASALAVHRRAQMTFLAGVAHDLKNPVSVLRLAVALINDRSTPEQVHEILLRVRRQLSRLERMIGDFLDVASVEAGTLELKMDVHDFAELVRQAADLFEGASADHRIVLAIPEHPLPLRCDALRIEQVVTNLVSNAIKYSPKATTIEVSVEREGNDAVVAVADHGIGIATADREQLFEPFRRVGLSKETVTGVGLGLYVVRQLVEAHGGRIDVASELGHGTTFKVSFPLS
jgi:two-component system sensor histidine kinase MtrB